MFRQSILFVACALMMTTAHSDCPDPLEIKKQTTYDQPRFYTDTGWISDAIANENKNYTSFELANVVIFNPHAVGTLPPQSVRCLYNIKDGQNQLGMLSLYPPYKSLSSGWSIAVQRGRGRWTDENNVYALCISVGAREVKCEFSLN